MVTEYQVMWKHGQFTKRVLCLRPHSTLFSFLLETFVFGASTHLGRYVGVISTIPFNF